MSAAPCVGSHLTASSRDLSAVWQCACPHAGPAPAKNISLALTRTRDTHRGNGRTHLVIYRTIHLHIRTITWWFASATTLTSLACTRYTFLETVSHAFTHQWAQRPERARQVRTTSTWLTITQLGSIVQSWQVKSARLYKTFVNTPLNHTLMTNYVIVDTIYYRFI